MKGRRAEPIGMAPHQFSIGDAARASGLTVKAIRYYEEIGLIPKAPRHNSAAHTGGNRVYSEPVVGRLGFIRHARLLGLSLADIRELLALADGRGCPSRQPEYQAILRQHVREIDERIRHLFGLRSTMEALMSPAPQPNGQACSWETCACMRAAEVPPSGER